MKKPKIVERVSVLGAGSWGTTLASHLASKGHHVSLWEFDARAADHLSKTRLLPVLPGLHLHEGVEVTSDIGTAVKDRAILVSATPSAFVRSTLHAAQRSGKIAAGAVAISVTKGLEEKSHKRMSEVIEEELHFPLDRIAVLSGPSHAEEVCEQMPTAIVAAARSEPLARRIQSLFSADYLRIYTHSDMIGVELGGTLKNVYAIACGISDGLGFGDNARAALLTRGLNEMSRIGVGEGAQLLTFFGLTGMGDLIVTCLSKHSRNRALGEMIGKGKSPAQALASMTMVAEGLKTAPSAYALARKLKLDCPLIQEIYKVLCEGKNPKTSLKDLMGRETLSEWQGLPEGAAHE